MKNALVRWIIFVVLLPFTAKGQTPEVDSLKVLLVDAKPDTNKVKWLADIAFYLYNVEPDESLEYGEEALELARKIGYDRGVMNAYYKMAIAKYSLGEYDKGIEYANNAMKSAQKIDYDLGVYYCYNILGVIYRAKSDAENALKYGFLSAKFSREHGDTVSEAIAYSNIGTIYLDNRDTSNAKKYFQQAIGIFRNTGQLNNVAEVLTNLSTVESDTAKKLQYIRESIDMAEDLGYDNALAYAHHNLGSFYWKERLQPLNAVPEYRRAINFATRTNDYYERTLLSTDMGALYEELGMTDSAEFYLQNGLALAREQDMKEQIREGLQTLADVHARKGNYRQAFESLSRSREIADSLYQSSLAEKLADADARFESSKKEARIAEQQLEIARQRNATNQALIGGLLVLLVTAGVFQYFFYKQRRKKKEAELALEMEHREADRLRELDGLKTRFFTNISHELRTPMNSILGYT
ncbi:MAG: histidine kinase dimerization/phospho-acceptor domain-containing protein, partial [Saprospiraceae bacterium]